MSVLMTGSVSALTSAAGRAAVPPTETQAMLRQMQADLSATQAKQDVPEKKATEGTQPGMAGMDGAGMDGAGMDGAAAPVDAGPAARPPGAAGVNITV